MRPVCSIVLLAASTPTNELRLSTSGSSRIARAARLLQLGHARVRDVLRGLDARLQLAGVLRREQALRDDDVEQHREHQRRERDQQRQRPGGRAPSPARGRSARSRGRRTRCDCARRCRAGFVRLAASSQRADIIGTSVSETTAEIRIVIASVTANSRNSRPTTSPMNSSGISTAISDTVSEMMVKPICAAPFSAASQRRLALLDVARDVLDHHDRVVDDEAGRDGQRHQLRLLRL